MKLWNEEKGKVTYRSSWATDLAIDEKNVVEMAECGRARWKIENEHNNVLKHHGYHLEHNFGHGKEHANELFCLLNLLAFLFHGIQVLAEDEYRRAHALFGGRRISSGHYATKPPLLP
jgi:hypothetical protein